MRKLLSNKSKFLAALCCLCLGLASLFAGVFSFVKLPASADEVVDANAGFYVEKGASFRYDDVVPAIRFSVALTEDQWEAYKTANAYTEDMAVKFDVVIHMANRPNQDGTTSTGYTTVSQEVTVKAVDNFFANNPGSAFTVKPAIMLTAVWNGETTDWNGETTEGKTSSELYALYAGAEFHVAGIKLTVNGAEVVKKDTTDFIDSALTLRSVRSVAASLLLQDKVVGETNIAIAENFIKDANGVKAELVKDDAKSFYDKYVDAGAIDISAYATEIETALDVKTTLGSTEIAVTGVADGVADVEGIASMLTDGKTYALNFDTVDTIYSFNNVIAATEIFYQANGIERLNARFAMTASGSTDAERLAQYKVDKGTQTETAYDADGNAYTLDFYGVQRGTYYVLGEDIDFGGNWSTNPTTTNALYHNGMGVLSDSGRIGFGGTFDGNGHTIKNIRFNKNLTTGAPLGLFGALAYGATVKNVAFVDAIPKYYVEAHRGGFILAGTAGGGTAAHNNFLKAKYGTTDCVLIDNCYFGFEDTYLGETTVSDAYSSENVLVWDRIKDSSDVSATTGNVYSGGPYGVIYEGHESKLSFKNCVLYMPSSERVTGVSNNGGIGWISRGAYGGTLYYDNGNEFENCYQISEKMYNGRVVSALEFHTFQKWDGSKWSQVGSTTEADYIANPQNYRAGGFTGGGKYSWEIFAANDYAQFANGTEVYSGLDADGKWVVAEATEDNGYTANTVVYHYNGVNRFENYVDMSANNTASTEGFNDNWTKVGNAVIWNGLADATAEKKLDLTLSSEAIGVGDVVDVTASFAGNNVTTLVTLSTNNDEVLSVNNVNKSFTVLKGGEATLYVTAGAYTAEYTVVATTVNETPVTVSSNASLIYGADAVYSIPYVANGKDLVATDFLSIYQQQFADNTATIGAVYLLDETGAKTALTATTVEGVAHYAFANAGNVKNAVSVIIDGSKGYMSFADISTVTGVIADAEGFNYIPSTEESRAGYYVLANDFNNTSRSDGRFTTRQDSILGVHKGDSDQMGYSFGGFDEEKYAKLAQNTTTLATAQNSAYVFGMYNAFVGTFDGLGHTIDNMFVDPVGLLGGFTDEYQPSTLKNVKFSNVRAGIYAWKQPYEEGVTPAVTMIKQSIIATLVYAPKTAVRGTLAEEYQIKLDNVVIEIAESGHRTDVANYLGTGDLFWTMFRGGRHMTYNEDGTYKGNGNFAVQQRSINKVAMDGVVFKVPTAASVGHNNSSNYGGTIFSYGDEGPNYAAYHNQVFAFRDLNNVYIISAPNANGKVACVTSEHTTASKLTNYGLAKNDFYSIFTEEYSADGNTGLYYYTATYNGKTYVSTTANCYTNPKAVTSGWGYVTTTAEDGTKSDRLIYAMNVGSYGQAGSEYVLASNETFATYTTGIAACTYTIFYPTSFERYDDYSAAVNAGVTQIGNFAVSADGIVWSPAN